MAEVSYHLKKNADAGGGGETVTKCPTVNRELLRNLLSCRLCGQLYREATTVTECLHTFCRSCIDSKIELGKNNQCPMPECGVKISGNPYASKELAFDSVLNDVVTKLFPRSGDALRDKVREDWLREMEVEMQRKRKAPTKTERPKTAKKKKVSTVTKKLPAGGSKSEVDRNQVLKIKILPNKDSKYPRLKKCFFKVYPNVSVNTLVNHVKRRLRAACGEVMPQDVPMQLHIASSEFTFMEALHSDVTVKQILRMVQGRPFSLEYKEEGCGIEGTSAKMGGTGGEEREQMEREPPTQVEIEKEAEDKLREHQMASDQLKDEMGTEKSTCQVEGASKVEVEKDTEERERKREAPILVKRVVEEKNQTMVSEQLEVKREMGSHYWPSRQQGIVSSNQKKKKQILWKRRPK